MPARISPTVHLVSHMPCHVCTLQIQSVAASAIRELLLLQPLLSLSILPFILLQLRLTAQQFLSTHLSGSQHSPDHDRLTAFGDSHSTDSAKTQVCLLRLLLPMAADASVAPFALRVIQQLLQEDSPVLVRCLGLRLLADLWLTYGRFGSPLPSLRDCTCFPKKWKVNCKHLSLPVQGQDNPHIKELKGGVHSRLQELSLMNHCSTVLIVRSCRCGFNNNLYSTGCASLVQGLISRVTHVSMCRVSGLRYCRINL